MKAQVKKWTMEDGVVRENRIVSEHSSVRDARSVVAELTANDPDCDDEAHRMTSARWTQYSITKPGERGERKI